jgi:hypothetical protein
MKTLNLNEEAGFRSSIENGISFTREQYEEKREESNKELVDFDDFIKNVAASCYENDGSTEDAIFIANDAFDKL